MAKTFKNLNDLNKYLSKPIEVRLSDLLNNTFMTQYTNCISLQDFLAKGNLSDLQGDDFANLNNITKLDNLVLKTSSFSSWEELKKQAAIEYYKNNRLSK